MRQSPLFIKESFYQRLFRAFCSWHRPDETAPFEKKADPTRRCGRSWRVETLDPSGVSFLAVGDELLFFLDVLFHVQEQQHQDQNAMGENFKAQEEEAGHLLMGERAAIVEQIEERHRQAVTTVRMVEYTLMEMPSTRNPFFASR